MKKLMKSLLSLLICFGTLAIAQPDTSEVEIKTIPVADNLYMLEGAGGNIGLFVGEDGAFVIDDQYAPMAPKITAAIKKITEKPVEFVVNTHWHGDHTGGNEAMGQAGAIIVAHDNVRKRLASGGEIQAFKMQIPPAPKAALPVITFDDEISFHWNGDRLEVFHPEPAHTDGDAAIYFSERNVLHAGDIFFNGFYPFIDPSSGGSARGMIAAVDELLAIVNEETKIIPGHGPLGTRSDLVAYKAMLETAVDAIATLKDKGMSMEEVVAKKPTAALDEKWGNGFLEPDVWVKIVYQTL